MDDVLDGEADDAAEWLGVEQDDGGRDPGLQRQVSIVQEATEQVYPLRVWVLPRPSEEPLSRDRSRQRVYRRGEPGRAPASAGGAAWRGRLGGWAAWRPQAAAAD